MKAPAKMVVLGLAVSGFGALRLPFEAGLTRELRAAGLAPEPLEIGTRDRIGQTGSAVALGGLRTLVATFLNLRAFGFFTEQRWADVESTYETIVDLAPRTRYYWESAFWHMAYDAASYYTHESDLPPLRRRAAWRSHILKGRAFLERGARNNPDDWSLHSNLGFLLSDSNKFPAFQDPAATFEAAAEAYRRAIETGNAPPHLHGHLHRRRIYALARVPDRWEEALALARSHYAESTMNHLPTLLAILLALEMRNDPAIEPGPKAVELFGTAESAYGTLSSYWLRTRERLPADGVAEALQSLEKTLEVPPEESVFHHSLQRPSGPDDWFGLPPAGMR